MHNTSSGKYPLRENAADRLKTFTGLELSDITAAAVADGKLCGDDLRTHADTLREQAQIALDAGYPQLAGNFLRAAELTRVPNEELLKVYEMLRPERATYEELKRLASYLESTYAAQENAAFIREAAEVYRERNLLRR